MAETPAVLYDADCGFCRWSLSKLLLWDRRRLLRVVPIDSVAGRRLLSGLAPIQQEASWHFVDRGGLRHSAAAAAAPLLRELPGGGPLAALSTAFPAVIETAYRWIADHRSTFSGWLSTGAVRRADARIAGRL